MKMLILSFLMDVFQGPNIPQETFQSPADFIRASNVSVLFPPREERDGGNVFMAFHCGKLSARNPRGSFVLQQCHHILI